jgi:predicted Zn-ribbon and HTH transcriptional regulator
MNGNCVDCGNEYQLDALNLDLRCAACVEQWVIDEIEGAKV